jgi:hypothetical protein
LLAAYNYVYGNSTQQSAALDFLYSISNNQGDLYDGYDTYNSALSTLVNPNYQLENWNAGSGIATAADYYGIGTVAASYDTSRSSTGVTGGAQLKLGMACYEGGWVWSPTTASEASSVGSSLTGDLGYSNGYSSGLTGAASGGPTGTSDTAANAANCIAALLNGNNQGLFTFTGTPNAALPGFKNDTRGNALVAAYLTNAVAAFISGGTRMALPAWFGFDGPGEFSLYLTQVMQTGTASTQAVNAITTFD